MSDREKVARQETPIEEVLEDLRLIAAGEVAGISRVRAKRLHNELLALIQPGEPSLEEKFEREHWQEEVARLWEEVVNLCTELDAKDALLKAQPGEPVAEVYAINPENNVPRVSWLPGFDVKAGDKLYLSPIAAALSTDPDSGADEHTGEPVAWRYWEYHTGGGRSLYPRYSNGPGKPLGEDMCEPLYLHPPEPSREREVLRELLKDVLAASVDESVYPDGPCLPKELRQEIRAILAEKEQDDG